MAIDVKPLGKSGTAAFAVPLYANLHAGKKDADGVSNASKAAVILHAGNRWQKAGVIAALALSIITGLLVGGIINIVKIHREYKALTPNKPEGEEDDDVITYQFNGIDLYKVIDYTTVAIDRGEESHSGPAQADASPTGQLLDGSNKKPTTPDHSAGATHDTPGQSGVASASPPAPTTTPDHGGGSQHGSPS